MNGSEDQERRESRLDAIRREAEERGRVDEPGIRAVGSPLPPASPENGYYQRPLLKEPQWTPLIPVYFFVGGAAGSLAVIGSLADLLGEEKALARKARWMALGGAGMSTVLLIADLGRPARFLAMLRILKPQSAMSVGSWVLAGFSASATLASFTDLVEEQLGGGNLAAFLRILSRSGSVLFGMPFHNYTGVLLGATVIPVWNNRIRSLPREFGMSGLQSAVSLLELTGETRSKALNAIGMMSAGFESLEGLELIRTRDRALKPAKKGGSGLLVQLAGVLSGPVPLALRLASLFTRKKKRLRQIAALSGIAGSLLLRYGWVYAGTVSARDWRLPLDIKEPEKEPEKEAKRPAR